MKTSDHKIKYGGDGERQRGQYSCRQGWLCWKGDPEVTGRVGPKVTSQSQEGQRPKGLKKPGTRTALEVHCG